MNSRHYLLVKQFNGFGLYRSKLSLKRIYISNAGEILGVEI